MGNLTVKLAVHVEVGVHQIEVHTTYVHLPDVRVDYATGIGNLKYYGISVFINDLLDGELVEVLRLVVGYLLSVY